MNNCELALKCRAKNAGTGAWVYGYPVPFPDSVSGWALAGDHYLTPDKGYIETEEFTEVLNDTICQFSGYTDYFNDPAFEGDIIFVKKYYAINNERLQDRLKDGNAAYEIIQHDFGFTVSTGIFIRYYQDKIELEDGV